VQQGIDHQRREDAWLEMSVVDNTSIERLRASWLQPEARTLEIMYGLSSTTDISRTGSPSAFDIPELRNRCQKLGVTLFTDTRMEEEQEREVDHEAEKQRQVERPPKAEVATHAVHQDVRKLIRTGLIRPLDSSVFVSAFLPFKHGATSSQDHQVWSPNLLATKDFLTTIQTSSYSAGDYMRPVNWIISSNVQGRLVLITLSPFEVNALLPEIRKSTTVHLHQYSPRVTQAMKSFDDLDFFCIPPLPPSWAPPTTHLVSQLNLWAGQLYLSDYQTYLQLCKFLGIYTNDLRSTGDISMMVSSSQSIARIILAHLQRALCLS